MCRTQQMLNWRFIWIIWRNYQAEFYKETSNILVSTLSDEEEDGEEALLLQVDQFLVLLLKRIAKSWANPCQNELVSRHKLPNIAFRQFDEDNTMLWFDQLHLQFKARGVLKEEEKFVLLLGYFSSDQALHSLHCILVVYVNSTFIKSKKKLACCIVVISFCRWQTKFDILWSPFVGLFCVQYRVLLHALWLTHSTIGFGIQAFGCHLT